MLDVISRCINSGKKNLVVVCLFFTFCSNDSIPQSDSEIRFFNLPGAQSITKSIALANGEWVLVGYEDKTATLNYVGSEGTILWQKKSDGIYYDVIEKSNRNLIVAGSVSNNLNNARLNGIVAEYSSNGELIWESEIPNEYMDEFYAIMETQGGNLVITGRVVIDKTKTQLVKLDEKGTIIWSKIYDIGLGNNFGRSLVQSTSGEYIIAGLCRSLTETRDIYGYDTYLAFIDPTQGNIRDTFLYYGDTSGSTNDVRMPFYSDNPYKLNLILKKNSNGYAWFTYIPGWYGTSKLQIVNVDLFGIIQAKNNYRGLNNFILHNVIQTPDNGYIACGQSSKEVINQINDNYFDHSLATAIKTDEDGKELWTTYLGKLELISSCIDGQMNDDNLVLLERNFNKTKAQTSFIQYKLDKEGNVKL